MAYNIAFGSSNGINVDLKFGETDHFYIYRVDGQDHLHVRQLDVVADAVGIEHPAFACLDISADVRLVLLGKRFAAERKPSRSSISK